MGKKTNSTIVFGSRITAQHRWVITGTATPQIANKSGALKNVIHLLSFLEHNFHRSRQDKLWNKLISRVWSAGSMVPFYRLNNLLSHLMVGHTKDDLMEIADPSFCTTCIQLSQTERTTYNTLASGMRVNLIATSVDG